MSVFLITGGSRGIGLELVRQCQARGDRVIATVRQRSAALEATGAEIHEQVDVTDTDAVAGLAQALRGRPIDVLVNCAGVLTREPLDELDLGSIHRQLCVNAIGPLRVTHALLGNLGHGAKVVIVSSRLGSIADNSSGGMYGYRMSKAAVNMAGRSLAVDLRPRRISVLMLHPGMVATDMTGGRGIPVDQSASGMLERIDALSMKDSGTFLHMNGDMLPW